ncbi:hypothetical protein GC170_00945 [bacterium]|nr:hypothetical protein [bacterium]
MRATIASKRLLRQALTLGLIFATGSMSVRAASLEESLPKNTLVFAKVVNAAALRKAFEQTSFGRMIQDPALKDVVEDVEKNLKEFSSDVKKAAGLSLKELLDLPTGEMNIAIIPTSDPKIPAGYYASCDAGTNEKAFADAMAKLIAFGTEKGSKVSDEEFQGVTIRKIESEVKDEDGESVKMTFAVAKTGTVHHVASTVDILKSVIKGAAADNLASVPEYRKATTKFRKGSQLQLFANVPSIVKVGIQAAAANADNAQVDAQQIETIVNMLGLGGVKAIASSVSLNDPEFDMVTTNSIILEKPVEGLLKVFKLQPSKLEPEAWVPGDVVSYQTMGWDFDSAYNGINDIVNMFNPGFLNVLEQQLVGPNGGDPLSLQKDIFGPLGNRVTIISDITKPVKEDSQRTLFAVALDDPNGFAKTLEKLFDLAELQPKKREFQGTTIYDIEPDLAAAGGVNVEAGKLSIAIAKNSLFVTSNVTLLESVLRGGSSKLADSPAYKAVSKHFPASTSSISFSAAEEASRATYEMLKQGQLDQALDAAAQQAGRGDAPDVGQLFDPKKLPDFSVFAKYMSNGGGYSVVDEDGVTQVQFMLNKETP